MKKLYYINYLSILLFFPISSMEKNNRFLGDLRSALDTGNLIEVENIVQQHITSLSAFDQHSVAMSLKDSIQGLYERDTTIRDDLKHFFPTIFMGSSELCAYILESTQSAYESTDSYTTDEDSEESSITPLDVITHHIIGNKKDEHGFLFEVKHNNMQIILGLVITVSATFIGGAKLYTRYYAWKKDQNQPIPAEYGIKITTQQRRISNGMPELMNPHVRQVFRQLAESMGQTRDKGQWNQQRQRLNFRSCRALVE